MQLSLVEIGGYPQRLARNARTTQRAGSHFLWIKELFSPAAAGG